MSSYAFEQAVLHAMLYEVGGFFKLTPEVEAGLISTRAQRRAVGYVNDPLDAGGETKFGVAKNANLDVDIARLTWQQAKEIYYQRYWLAGSCQALPPRIAVLHFDGCVNHGIKQASKFLQRAVNVDDDGQIGPMTLDAVENFEPIEVCEAICDQRANFYHEIVNRKPSQARFLDGWLRRITEMRDFTCNPEIDF